MRKEKKGRYVRGIAASEERENMKRRKKEKRKIKRDLGN